MEFNDPATFEIDLGSVPSLWRNMHFTFEMNNMKPSKVRILTTSTEPGRKPYVSQTMGEDGIKNLRAMCDKALAYFERAKSGPARPQEAQSAGSVT